MKDSFMPIRLRRWNRVFWNVAI